MDFKKRQLIQRLLFLSSQVASGKRFIEDVAINTTPTFAVQIKEHGQSGIVDKAGVTVDVGAQIGCPRDSQIYPQLAPKLNVVNSRTLLIFLISQVTSTNNFISFSGQKVLQVRF